MNRFLIILFTIAFMAIVSCGDDVLLSSLDDNEGAVSGMALLENMTEHSNIRVELVEIETSLLTDESGEYWLPENLAEGDWTLMASYPYFCSASTSFIVQNGTPTNDISNMELAQRVHFTVITDKQYYTTGETVQITLRVENLTDEDVTLASSTEPQTAFVLRRDGETKVGEGLFGGEIDQPSFVTVAPDKPYLTTFSWTIEDTQIEGGEYELYAVLVDSANYPDYFAYDPSEPNALNESLFSKLTPAMIAIQ